MDKTGTMTEGVFKVQEVVLKSEFNKDEILKMVNALESQSTHPVATAIHQYVGEIRPRRGRSMRIQRMKKEKMMIWRVVEKRRPIRPLGASSADSQYCSNCRASRWEQWQ